MTVRIICGGYGASGGRLIRNGETVEVPDMEGQRLIELKVAEAVRDRTPAPAAAPAADPVPDGIHTMTRKELFAEAKARGLKVGGTTPNSEIIALLESGESGGPDLEGDGLVL